MKPKGNTFLRRLRLVQILHSYKSVKAGHIYNLLRSEGLLEGGGSNARRVLNYDLSLLQELGIIELEGKGNAARWRLKREIFPQSVALLPHQKGILLLLLLLAEEAFLKNLGGEITNILSRLGLSAESIKALERDTNFKYLYAVDAASLLPLLGRIVQALENKSPVQILLKGKGESFLKLRPLGVGVRDGRIYLVALEGNKKRCIPLDRIENISLLTWEEVDGKGESISSGDYTLGRGEKPFILGLKTEGGSWTRWGSISFHPFVFHSTSDDTGKRILYLVGFDSDYFASRFLPHLGEPLAPSEGMLKIARQKGSGNLCCPMPLEALSYHRSLYSDFLKRLRRQLSKRIKAVENALNSFTP